jgi:hypothetical protein
LALLAITFLASSTITVYTSTIITLTMPSSSNPLEGLALTLSQTSASPPTVRATVTNNNAHPVTIVTYNSPLDSIAMALGLLVITPSGASEPLELQIIKASRLWPPKSDSLVGLGPGESATNDLVLKRPTVPMEKLGSKAMVHLRGTWMGVFAKSKDELTADDLENMSTRPYAFQGDFESENIEIAIE